MKKYSLLLMILILLSVCSSFQQVTGQEKTKAEKEKETKILQDIEKQKREMTEQMKENNKESEREQMDVQEEVDKILKDKHMEIDEALKDIQLDINASDEDGNTIRIYRKRDNRPFRFEEPFTVSPGIEAFSGFGFGDDSERSTWNFSKSVKESTFSKTYTFDVENSARTVVMSVMGDCIDGEIRIQIVMPDGKNYSDVVIDESGNLNWRKSFTISETENQDKTGQWKFGITATNATGHFKISFQTY
ncbi:MAG: hypothetical protein LLG13_00355 [Bacteroidales bacterium]|nr:hypothetical protein [Bacteroidales bacterium]